MGPPERPSRHKLCPVCGRRYVGALSKHLDNIVKRSEGVTRCDWNLVEARIHRTVEYLLRDGWVQAGTTGARVAQLLHNVHNRNDLAKHTTSGAIGTRVHVDHLNPANDLKCWWIKRWARHLATTPGWSQAHRGFLILELEDNTEALELIEATHRIGGPQAVRALEGTVIPARCETTLGSPSPIISRGTPGPHARCNRQQGHAGEHNDGICHTWAAAEPPRK